MDILRANGVEILNDKEDYVFDSASDTETDSIKSSEGGPLQEVSPKEDLESPAKPKKMLRPPSKWFYKPWGEKTFAQKLASFDDIPERILKTISVEEYEALGPVPHQSLTEQNIFVSFWALLPMAVQYISYKAFPQYTWHPLFAFFVYHAFFVKFVFAMIKYLNGLQAKFGAFDAHKRPRDIAPDSRVNRLVVAVTLYTIVRTAGPILLRFDRNELPHVDIFTPVRVGVWMIVLDYFFYAYHRTTHQFDAFWFVHSAHHGTKHPTVLLSILADEWQEFLELFLCPALASLVVPSGFFDLYVTSCYMIFIEAMGHSGCRADLTNPILFYVLKPFGMDLVVEDHDAHHRHGRAGLNYGKQSRVWDRIFGTAAEREETFR